MDSTSKKKAKYIEKLLSNIILDIHAEPTAALNAEETEYHKTISKERREIFIYMSKTDRAKLINKQLSVQEEDLMWKAGSTMALHYINEGYIYEKSIPNFTKWAKYLCLAALFAFSADIYFNTYAKNRQLHIESFAGQPKYELDPSALNSINAHKQTLNDATNLMDVATYKTYISTPGFACGELLSVKDSFYQTNGKPLCKKNDIGDVYVVGYVVNPTFPQPVFNVIHQGKVFNIDMSNDAALGTAVLPGLEKITFSNIPYSFQNAFPEIVREQTADVITKLREKK